MAHIKTYCRIKPTNSTFHDHQIGHNVLHIQVPENHRESSVSSNTRHRATTNHDFKFSYIFKQSATQEEVFDKVSKDIVEGFLGGYNGTIFAYGQTGSGKTYTVEGNARRYKDRGLAPRAISLIYKSLASRSGEEIDVHVSYMELYQEVGYDLLNPAARLGSVVTSFPKVSVVEGARGSCVIRNLSQHLAANEEIAQSLLIEGQANRKVAETPMNQRSSRSHAVFTIHLSVKKPNDDIITRSKLHLVDLAGSERVSKTGIDGQQLAEAKYINLSLHYLEGVIIALQQETTNSRPNLPTPNFTMYNRVEFKARSAKEKYASGPSVGRCYSAPCLRTQSGLVSTMRPTSASVTNPQGQSTQQRHIPYRNSLLTMVLKDSLGGNCQTAMIATITLEEDNLGESVSTCRFSQRVACITNIVSKNEELDDKSLIRRLRKRVAELESEVSMLREGLDLPAVTDGNNKLSPEDKLECARIMQNYLTGRQHDPITAGIRTPARFRECLRLLKKLILDHYGRDNNENQPRVTLDAKSQKAIAASSQPTRELPAVKSHNSQDSNEDNMPFPITVKDTPGSRSENVSHDATRRPKSAVLGKEHRDRMSRRLVSEKLVSAERPRPERSRSPIKPRVNPENKPEPAPRVSRDSYKSPFDQQREREVRRLDQKVSREQQTLENERSLLTTQQTQIKLAQLHLLKEQLSTKLSGAQDQLRDHKLYILQLQQMNTDPDIIQQEKIVAKQLRKREIRVERRLKLVTEQLESVQADLADTAQPVPKPRTVRSQNLPKHSADGDSSHIQNPTVIHQGQNPTHVSTHQSHTARAVLSRPGTAVSQRPADGPGASGHGPAASGHGPAARGLPQNAQRDGKVNTRQVLDALKAQDQQQEKMKNDLEKEKVFTLSKQIETKEAATRQKLLDFKEKLRQAKLGNFQARKRDSSPDQQAGLGSEQAKPPIPSPRSAFVQPKASPRKHNITTVQVPSNTAQAEKPANEHKASNLTSASQTSLAWMTPKASEFGSRTNSMDTLQGGDAGIDPESRHGSRAFSFVPGSRISSAGSTRKTALQLAEELSHLERKRNISQMWGRDTSTPSTVVNPPEIPQFVSGDISGLSVGNMSTLPVQAEGYEDTPRLDESFPRAPSQGSFDIGRSISETNICDAEIQKVLERTDGPDSGLHSDSSPTFHPHGYDVKPDQKTPQIAKSQPKPKTRLTQPQALAEEFVNDSHSNDASQPNFSHKKFDEVLQKMLGADTQPTLNYTHEHYNQFARPNDRPHNKPGKSQRKGQNTFVKLKTDRTSESSTEAKDKHKFNPWGPEAKGMTVGERIAKYLEVSSKDEPTGTEEAETPDGGSDLEQSKVKVTALEEEDREQSYMTSMRAERLRVARIRKARSAAEVIQRSWRKYKRRK